ncbi:LOW QUALITY PROTEIN: zinc protease-like protein y4wB [Picochlorum sp. SENEW3]|nr:LOW QUALITY PROTEIN: zinc protease-like protein y4wB [Picochlorum sp. SENEW3]
MKIRSVSGPREWHGRQEGAMSGRVVVPGRALHCSRAQTPASASTGDIVRQATVSVVGSMLALQLGCGVSSDAHAGPPPPEVTTMYQFDQRVKSAFDSLPSLPESFAGIKTPDAPTYTRLRLKNGVRLILLEDHEVPLVRGIVSIKGGDRLAPASNPALSTLSASIQRSGGSVSHPEEEFDEILESMSAQIEGGSGSEAVTFGFSCLKGDASRVVGLVSEMDPHLSESKLRLNKLQLINALAHKNDSPQNVPLREIEKLIYGKDSVYIAEPTEDQIVQTTMDDMRAWIQKHENPKATVIGIVGDFNTKRMTRTLQDYFQDWKSDASNDTVVVPNPGIPDQTDVAGNVYVIDSPGLRQSTVAVAEPGIALKDPDEIDLGILSELLNSFGGSLFDRIRSKEGLAYSVSAGWASTPIDHPGLFLATAQTERPAPLLKSLFTTLDMATTMIPSEEEFSRAQEQTLNSFVFSFASLQNQLRRAVIFETFGIDENYIYEYMDKVKTATPQSVQAAAARHLHPKQMTVMIIGDAKSIVPDIKRQFPDRNVIMYPLE